MYFIKNISLNVLGVQIFFNPPDCISFQGRIQFSSYQHLLCTNYMQGITVPQQGKSPKWESYNVNNIQ